MPPWKEVHYARVQEFIRLLAGALPPAASPPPAPPTPAPAAAKAPEPAVAPLPPVRPAASTAIGKIPWKR